MHTEINQRERKFDLEVRTFRFASDIRAFIKSLPNQFSANPDHTQLKRASGSVGANYIEANEALSKRDFANRIKICRKESKEARYWLRLIAHNLPQEYIKENERLSQEAYELLLIFNAILQSMARKLPNSN